MTISNQKPDIAKNGFKEAGITFIKKLIE